VLCDPRGDRLRVAPGHQSVDEPIGELRDLVLGEAHAAQVRRVAAAARGQKAERPTRKLSGLLRVRLDGDELPDNERGVVAKQRTRLRGVLGRDEKRVCAGTAVAGQLQHAGPEGRQDARGRWHRRRHGVERIQVASQRLQRLGPVRATEPDDEPTRMGRVDLGVRGGHGRTVEAVDRDDAAGDPDVVGGVDDVADLLEAFERATGQPDRRIAQLRQLPYGVEEAVALSGSHSDADGVQLELGHALLPLAAAPAAATISGNTAFDAVVPDRSSRCALRPLTPDPG